MTYEKGPEKSRDSLSSEGFLLLNSSSLLLMTELKSDIPESSFVSHVLNLCSQNPDINFYHNTNYS